MLDLVDILEVVFYTYKLTHVAMIDEPIFPDVLDFQVYMTGPIAATTLYRSCQADPEVPEEGISSDNFILAFYTKQ